jgi:hypothetical protein
MKYFVLASLFAMTLGLGCGKGGDESSKKAEVPEAPPKKAEVPEAPPFDCGNFEKRASECSAELTASYATTASAELLQGKTPEEKAKALTSGIDMLKKFAKNKNVCEHVPAWGNLKEKDPLWQVRYNKCKADAPCAEWGKCVGEALGKPLTP